MLKIPVRNLLKHSTDELWSILSGNFIVVFDDGELTTNSKETQYSSYVWDLHREFPKTPVLMRHHVQSILKGNLLSSSTHLKLLESVVWDVHKVYLRENPNIRDHLARRLYEITNLIYNELTMRLGEYVVSIDITDFTTFMTNPEVSAILDKIEPNNQSIAATYKGLTALLRDKTKFINNPIARALQSGLANENQVMQCVGPRGYLTDIDSVIFTNPILRGFASGIRSLHDAMLESRSAAKSSYFSKDLLPSAEYFARRVQLVGQEVKTIHHVDCGSKEYIMFKVRGKEMINGKVSYKGDLQHIEGKYYLDEQTKQLRAVRASDTHLVGKTIKMRSVIAGCQHPDPHGVCAVCFGELSYSVPDNTVIGQDCAASMTQQSSQSVLSTKHLDSSSTMENIVLSAEVKKYIKAGPDNISFYINDRLKSENVSIVVDSQSVLGLTDIDLVKQVEDLNLSRVSEIEALSFMVETHGQQEFIPVSVMVNGQMASFTYDFLNFIKERRWTDHISATNKNCYVINLSEWKYNRPFLTLPFKHFNMAQHSKSIADIIESSVSEMLDRGKSSSPAATLIDLYETVNNKLNINLAVLEIILYSEMIVSAENNDYRLPKVNTDKGLGVSRLIMVNRSEGITMAYQEQRDTIVNPVSFVETKRPDHPMDVFLMPYDVIKGIQETF